ncbi:MAG: DUF1761 family protein [Saprospiraceae bacterium]|nr:DUF1761 family protein [Saprospiraceae bacterium]
MAINYTAFFLISFIPLIIAWLWYSPGLPVRNWFGQEIKDSLNFNIWKLGASFLLSLAIVYGYINLVIHQMGFYELFFTDIMMGSQDAKNTVESFLAIYGDKHRHFGHGIFHGAINGFIFAGPFVGFFTLIQSKGWKFFWYHFAYWLLTSIIICGLISEFV